MSKVFLVSNTLSFKTGVALYKYPCLGLWHVLNDALHSPEHVLMWFFESDPDTCRLDVTRNMNNDDAYERLMWRYKEFLERRGARVDEPKFIV